MPPHNCEGPMHVGSTTAAPGQALLPVALSLPTSAGMPDRHLDVYRRIVLLLEEYVAGMGDKSKKVVEFATPQQITSALRAACAHAGDGEVASPDEILGMCEVVMQYSVRTSSPFFFNQLYGRVDPVALAADYILSTLNTNAFTYEVAPVFTTLEKAMVKKLLNVFGLPADSEGLFVPGGSMANIYGMHMARSAKLGPAVKREGLRCCEGQLVGFCSADAHYSYSKGANLLGLGTDHIRSVPVDPSAAGRGSMRVDVLEEMVKEALAEGKVPFLVGATAGTTVYGGFDDMVALRELCDRHGLWLHIDGAWGGAVAFRAEGGAARDLARGFGGADSFSWNPHKMMGTPLQTSVFMCRRQEGGGMQGANGCKATYCFQDEKNFADEDVGDMTLQCSRRADSFKLWLLWQAIGDAGLSWRVDRAMELSAFFARTLGDAKAMRALGVAGSFVMWREQAPFFCNVCFYYVPPALTELKGTPFWDLGEEDERCKRIKKVAPYIKDRMQRRGTCGMVGFCGQHNLFRLVLASPIGLEDSDMTDLIIAVDAEGRDYKE